MKMGLIDWVGVLGGITMLFAFWRTSIGKWTGKSLWYELDNFVAAALMMIYAFSKGAYVNIVLNAIWGTVAVVGVTSYAERRIRRRRRRS